MSHDLTKRLIAIQASANLESNLMWSSYAIQRAVSRLPIAYEIFLRNLKDEDIKRIMFTDRRTVTLTPVELATADELTIQLLDAEE